MFVTPKQPGRSSLLGRTPLTAVRRSVQSTPRNTPGIATRSARAEQVLEETGQHVVRALNSPVPVQVQEALRSNVRAASIQLHESGWAWLVAGSKLFLWKFSTLQLTAQCWQLSFPSSSTVGCWNTELATVCSVTESSVSVMAVSPEGLVCYWSNALRDPPTTLEGSLDVGEGRGYMLVGLPSGRGGCLLTTSLGNLFLITPPASAQDGLGVRQMHVPRGMFSGIGRRVSSLFFGSQDPDTQEARRVLVTASGSSGVDVAFVLTSSNLQKWSIEQSSEMMQYDAALEGIVKEAVMQQGWFADESDGSSVQAIQLSLWTVDLQLTSEYACVLFAVVREGAAVAEHGLALIQTESDVTPLSVDHLIRLNHLAPYRPGGDALLKNYSLLSGSFTTDVLMYNRNAVLVANVEQRPLAGSPPDLVNFPHPNGIIGTGVHNGGLLFFTLNQGVVSVAYQSSGPVSHTRHPPSSSSSLLATPSVGIPAMVSSFHEASAEKTEALKSAFMEYLSENVAEAAAICECHFPPESFSLRLDTPGDLAVTRLSEMVLDDLPASDPRLGETTNRDTPGSSSSVIIIYQLEDKLQAHYRYTQFITDIGLLDKLTCVHVRGHPMLTRQLLCEHAEKITAAITLRKMHNQVVDQAIKLALQQRPSSLPSHPGLTNQDIFYTQVSCLEDIFQALITTEEDLLSSFNLPQERVQLVLSVAAILEAMLHEAVQYRQAKSSLYQSCIASENPDPEWLPWTASLGSSGSRNCIAQQLQVLLDTGARDVESGQEQQNLWRLVVDLCDLLFDGYRAEIASIEKNPTLSGRLAEVRKHFEESRERFLMPLLEHGQYQKAAELGERYEDFRVLVHLCEKMGSRGQLQDYMTRFSDKGFADFLFKKYLDQGQLQQLLSFSEDFPRELGRFLEPHDHLSWMHHISTQDYSKAHQTLLRMADGEAKYVGKKKTLLSLSKLAMLTSESVDSETLQVMNRQLQVIELQQNIPFEVLEASGLNPEEMPPLQPEEIIQLYVGENNPNADEMQYLCALEFLDLAYPDHTTVESQELRVYIWSQAVLKDNWSQLSTDDPLRELQSTFFFQLVGEAYNRGFDKLAILPELETLLTSQQLTAVGLTKDPSFQFLMKAGYEQLERIQSFISD